MHEFRSVRLDEIAGEMVVLDQTLLPREVKYLRLSNIEEIYEAIQHLRVRGAPAIGIAAAFGIYVSLRASHPNSLREAERCFEHYKDRLADSRPTAVNLFWALDRMSQCCRAACAHIQSEEQNEERAVAMLLDELKHEALLIQTEDARMCRAIGEYGLELLQPNMGILTHCNAGALATSELGTALAPLYLGNERGYRFKVFADETRPLLQGARLTAWELSMAKIDVTVICDNMAASVIKKGLVKAVLVGCDRIAANGDVANKIGTSGIAILARYYNVPFYVLGPTSSIDWACGSGSEIEIEERHPEEISTLWYTARMVPDGVSAWNPAFDVTDGSLISAIVTEKGIAYPPYARTLSTFR